MDLVASSHLDNHTTTNKAFDAYCLHTFIIMAASNNHCYCNYQYVVYDLVVDIVVVTTDFDELVSKFFCQDKKTVSVIYYKSNSYYQHHQK